MANFGRDQILHEHGRGGMSTVSYAYDVESKRYVALKLLRDRGGELELAPRFQREIDINRELEHPNIVKTWDGGTVGGQMFIAMEYMDGGSLQQRLAGGQPQSLALACNVASQIGAA